MQNQLVNCIEEDEIDLRELFKTIGKNKMFIIKVTTAITLMAVIYALTKTPWYNAEATIEIGKYKDEKGQESYIDDAVKLSQRLQVRYIDILKNVKERESKIEQISTLKKVKSFISIKSTALSNELAVKEIDTLVDDVKIKHQKILDEILEVKQNQLKDLERQIILIRTNTLKSLDEQLTYLQKNQLPAINTKIDFLKNNKIPALQNKIVYLKEIELPTLKRKITSLQDDLVRYEKELSYTKENNKKLKDEDPALAALRLVQEQGLETRISSTKLQLINMQEQYKAMQQIKLQELQNQLDQLKNIELLSLNNEKDRLVNKTIPELIRKKENVINNRLAKLYDQENLLQLSMQPHNYQNTQIIGEIITNDYPAKPKKKLIVIVAFVTGLILSIFLVFFLEFIRSFKEEEQEKKL